MTAPGRIFPGEGTGSSGSSGPGSSMQISLRRRPSSATSRVIRMACSSAYPPSLTGAPSRLIPVMIWVMAAGSMTSRSRGTRLTQGSS